MAISFAVMFKLFDDECPAWTRCQLPMLSPKLGSSEKNFTWKCRNGAASPAI